MKKLTTRVTISLAEMATIVLADKETTDKFNQSISLLKEGIRV